MEPLATAIRKDDNFPGVTYNGCTHKLMMFADDILLLVSDPVVSIPSLLNTINVTIVTLIYSILYFKKKCGMGNKHVLI